MTGSAAVRRSAWAWRNMSWATKLAVLLAALSILPLVALAFYNRVSSQRDLIEAARVSDLQRARGTASTISTFLDNIAAQIRTAAVSPYVIGLSQRTDDPAAASALESRLRDLHDIERFEEVFVADRRGIVVASTRADLIGTTVLARRWFLSAAAGQTRVDDPELDERSGRFMLHISSPLKRPNQAMAGVLAATIPVSFLNGYASLDTNFRGAAEFGVLWNADGITLVHPTNPALLFKPLAPLTGYDLLLARRRFGPAVENPAADRSTAELVDRSRWLLYDADADPYLRVSIGGGGAAYVAMVPIPNKRWIYGVFTPEDRLIAELDARTRRDLAIALLVALAAILLSMAAGPRVAQPVLRIARTANDIAGGDLSRRVGIRQDDEVGQVAAAFDHMLDALASKDAQLKTRADQLERRVAERTAELQTLYAQAQEANRLKDEFLGTVSHELRTPLNAILGWSRMLRTQLFDPARVQRALETIERNAQAQAQLVDDLLDVSRIISGKLRLDLRSIDLGSVVAAAIDATRPAADAKHIELTSAIDPDATGVLGDPQRLQQIVWNLLSNAIKFTPEGGRVSIDARRAGPSLEIVVSDTGVGIAPEFLPHVFDRFSQADSSTTRRHGGLGLGLAIVRHLVELHGGTVAARSDGPGRGATFMVRLPMAAPERIAAQSAARPGSVPLAPLAGARVLIVDDETDGRELTAAVLDAHGAHAVTATTVREALDLVARNPFDVVISDIGMPEEDGFALLAQLRAHADATVRRIPVLALTAYAAENDRQQVLAAGFQGYLAKPAEPDEIARAIGDVLPRM